MKPRPPTGFAALLARMPRAFVAQAKAVEDRARRRRKAQAKRFERDFQQRAAESRLVHQGAWQDTVAAFTVK